MGAFTTSCCADKDDFQLVTCCEDSDDAFKTLEVLPSVDGHYIYMMRNEFYKDNVVKIGRTNNLVRRIKELNNQMLEYHIKPIYYCDVPDEKFMEQYLHDLFNKQRIDKTREWFQVDPQCVVDAIERKLADMQKVLPNIYNGVYKSSISQKNKLTI